MSVQWGGGPNWKARGFASLRDYEQYLEDEAQCRYLAEHRRQHPNGGGCGKTALFAMLHAVVIWSGIVALWMQPWRP